MTKDIAVDLTSMIDRVGISRREFARQLGTSHTNISAWEKSGWIAKTEFIAPAANILGVTIEELLGLPKSRNNPNPGGKLGQVFEAVSHLPRRQQEKVIEMAEGFIALHDAKAS